MSVNFTQILNKLLSVKISSSDITVPTSIQSTTRTFQYTSTATIAASGSLISPTFDFSGAKYITGFVSTDQPGTLYIQESDDGYTWFNTGSVAVIALTNTTISATVYASATSYSQQLTSRYVRVAYLNGATANTKFTVNVYSNTL